MVKTTTVIIKDIPNHKPYGSSRVEDANRHGTALFQDDILQPMLIGGNQIFTTEDEFVWWRDPFYGKLYENINYNLASFYTKDNPSSYTGNLATPPYTDLTLQNKQIDSSPFWTTLYDGRNDEDTDIEHIAYGTADIDSDTDNRVFFDWEKQNEQEFVKALFDTVAFKKLDTNSLKYLKYNDIRLKDAKDSVFDIEKISFDSQQYKKDNDINNEMFEVGWDKRYNTLLAHDVNYSLQNDKIVPISYTKDVFSKPKYRKSDKLFLLNRNYTIPPREFLEFDNMLEINSLPPIIEFSFFLNTIIRQKFLLSCNILTNKDTQYVQNTLRNRWNDSQYLLKHDEYAASDNKIVELSWDNTNDDAMAKASNFIDYKSIPKSDLPYLSYQLPSHALVGNASSEYQTPSGCFHYENYIYEDINNYTYTFDKPCYTNNVCGFLLTSKDKKFYVLRNYFRDISRYYPEFQ